jgi:hypothetical protein
VQQVDTTTLYAQIQDDLTRFRTTNEADFNAWVQSIKGILGEDEAGNLLNLINGLAGPGRTTETVKGNADNIAALQTDKADKTEIPTQLPNPSALTISQGYGGTTGTYNGSTAKSISIPRITLHTSAPGTVSDGELWGVY